MPSTSSRIARLTAASALALMIGGLAASESLAATPMDTLASVSQSYNLYLSGDMGAAGAPISYSDTEGKVAVGGNAYIRGYDIGLMNQGGDALVVGKDLNFQSGTIHGNVAAGGVASFPTNNGGTTVAGTVRAGGGLGVAPTAYSGVAPYAGLPLDFTATSSDLGLASSFLASAGALAQGSLGTALNQYGTLHLSSAAGGLVFFDLNATDLTGISGISFEVAPTSTVILNLSGEVAPTIGYYGMWGSAAASRTLFNFVDATSVTLGGIAFEGSILAPKATVNFSNGHIDGVIMAKALTGSGQLNWTGYTGGLPTMPTPPVTPINPVAPVPEPSTWAMLMIGVAALGGMLRRRARTGPLALA